MVVAKRNDIIDMAKGGAMLMTIFCHALQRAVPSQCTEYIVWRIVHDWHMPMFFLLSGFLAAKSSKLGSIEFIKDKFFRLIYVWFVWRWLQWVFMRFSFSGLLPFNSYVPTSFMGNLLSFIKQPFRPMWFLFDLFIFFVILSICKYVSKDRKCVLIILLSIITIGSIFIYHILKVKSILYGTSLVDGSWNFLYYDIQYWGIFCGGFVGSLFLRTEKEQGIDIWKEIAIVSTFAGGMIIVGLEYLSDTLGIFLFWGKAVVECLVVLGILLIINRIKGLGILGKILVYVGKHSMQYYTLQFLCLNCGGFIADTNMRWIFNFVACMIICTVVIEITNRSPEIYKIFWWRKYE